MRKSIVAIISVCVLLAAIRPAEATIDVALQMQLGNPSGSTADTNNHSHYLIQRTVEAIDYNDYSGEPNWASWDLTASDIGSSGRSSDFVTDASLPSDFYEVTTADYSGAGFDRGHMCPSADRTDNDTDNGLVFLMSNIIPQAASNNSGVWGTFEGYCRSLAQSGDELMIICGPGGFDGSFIQPSQRVLIPEYVWKVVVVIPPGTGTALSRITGNTRVIAIKIPNNNSVGSAWQSYVTSPRQIEADTGLTFFTALPPDVANALRDEVDGVTANLPVITGFAPASGAVNAGVIITGVHFNSASEVTFNGTSTPFVVNSDTQITATVPNNAASGPVSVTIPGGTAVSSTNFAVTGSSADLAAVATHFGNFSQGDTGDTYTINVTNVGTLTSTGLVSVADALPSGLTATTVSGVGWTVNPGTLTCTRTSPLIAGAGYPPIFVTVNVSASAPASVTNAVTVSNAADANPANNSAADITTIIPSVISGTVVSLAAWDMSPLPGGASNYGPSPLAPTTTAPGMTVGGLTRGSGVGTGGTGAGGGWGGTDFAQSGEAAAIAANEFVTFTLAAPAGETLSFTSISQFNYRRSGTGPGSGVLQCQIGTGAFTDITSFSYPSTSTSGGSLSPINLSGVPALQNIGAGTNVIFRIVNYGGGAAGTWYVYDTTKSTAPDFVVQGTLSPATASDLGIAMAHAGDFTQGDVGDTYAITVTNGGTTASAGEVSVADSLPAGLTATSISGAGWTTDLGTLTCTRSESLAPGAAYPPITVIVNVNTNAASSVTNVATVSGGGDINAANNLAGDPTSIIALTPIQAWRLQWFGTTADTGDAADATVATSDGMPNLLKYALGLNPLVPAANPAVGDISTGYLRLTLPKNPAATDVIFSIEVTADLLVPWTANGVIIDQDTPSLLQAHGNVPVNSAATGFIRLRVARP